MGTYSTEEPEATFFDPFILGPSKSAMSGKILSQIAEFSGEKIIHKVSLNFSVTSIEKKIFFEQTDHYFSFPAANFQKSRDSWAFQPINHWTYGYTTSGTTIKNTFQNQFISDPEIAVQQQPMLQYELFFNGPGVYDLWGYGYTSDNGAFWSIQGDTTNIHELLLGNNISGYTDIPYWTKFGTIYIKEGGLYTFEVFLSDATSVVLDQWFFTENTNFVPNSYTAPTTRRSNGPYNTIIRLRSLNENELDSLENPIINNISVVSYLSSQKIFADGKFNYNIQNSSSSGVSFTDGLSIDYWQVGGSNKDFASWNYNLEEGRSYLSSNYGQTFVEE